MLFQIWFLARVVILTFLSCLILLLLVEYPIFANRFSRDCQMQGCGKRVARLWKGWAGCK